MHQFTLNEYPRKINENSSRKEVIAAARHNRYVLEYADESLKKDRDIFLEVVTYNGLAFEYADESLKKDRDIVLEAVKHNYWAFEYADKSLKKDPETVLAAVKYNYRALRYADESLKAESDVVLAAVKQDGRSLQYASESLTDNASFFWRVWNIQQSGENDDSRKEYINRYLLKETAKILIGAGLTIASGLLLSSIITLPFPVLLILIAATAVGAIYTFNKLAEHGYGFFKARAELSIPVTKDALTI